MFNIRPYEERDALACGECLYEGFFHGPIDGNDRELLKDYGQILIEKCNFAYVAESEGRVVGFISGKYDKRFDRKLAKKAHVKRNYGAWIKMFVKFYCKGYSLSPSFQKEFDAFFAQLRERDQKAFGTCDLELVALSSKKDYRKGLGTALLEAFLNRAKEDGAKTIRLFTNTLASYQFYEKKGFTKVADYPFKDGSGQRSLIYEIKNL